MQIATSYKTRQSAGEYAERLMPYGTASDTLPSAYRMLFRTDVTVTHRSFRYFSDSEFSRPRDCANTLYCIALTLMRVERLSRLSLSVIESNICLLNRATEMK